MLGCEPTRRRCYTLSMLPPFFCCILGLISLHYLLVCPALFHASPQDLYSHYVQQVKEVAYGLSDAHRAYLLRKAMHVFNTRRLHRPDSDKLSDRPLIQVGPAARVIYLCGRWGGVRAVVFMHSSKGEGLSHRWLLQWDGCYLMQPLQLIPDTDNAPLTMRC